MHLCLSLQPMPTYGSAHHIPSGRRPLGKVTMSLILEQHLLLNHTRCHHKAWPLKRLNIFSWGLVHSLHLKLQYLRASSCFCLQSYSTGANADLLPPLPPSSRAAHVSPPQHHHHHHHHHRNHLSVCVLPPAMVQASLLSSVLCMRSDVCASLTYNRCYMVYVIVVL